ncbi:MAG: hypothetical protein WDN49_03670 [Acetobacteraceae bacterium]
MHNAMSDRIDMAAAEMAAHECQDMPHGVVMRDGRAIPPLLATGPPSTSWAWKWAAPV